MDAARRTASSELAHATTESAFRARLVRVVAQSRAAALIGSSNGDGREAAPDGASHVRASPHRRADRAGAPRASPLGTGPWSFRGETVDGRGRRWTTARCADAALPSPLRRPVARTRAPAAPTRTKRPL